MKIAYVYYTDHNLKSAHSNQIIHTCNALTQVGQDVTVITTGGLEEYANEHGLELLFDICETTIFESIQYSEQVFYYFKALRAANTHDVIYTRDISFLKFLIVVPDVFKPTIIFEAHKCYSVVDGMGQNEERNRLKQADGLITISDGIRIDLENLGVTVDAVVRDAANTNYVPSTSKSGLRKRTGIDQDATVWIYAGSLDSSKYNLKDIISGFSTIRGDENHLLYILGGDSSNIDKLQQYSKSVGVSEAVHFVGHVPQREVFEYLKASDIGIVAQQPTDIRASKYTSPLKLFEYLVSGLIVVATDVPSIGEIADHEPRILTYNPDDSTDLESVLETAAREYDLIESDNSDTQYSYKNRAKAILSVLEECVES